MDDKPRFHFTLTDLLAIVAVLAIACAFVAMFIPRVTSGPAGRNTQCKNNIRQLAVALDGYQHVAGNYPGRLQNLGGQTVPWTVAMFPQFERLDLHQDWADRKITGKPTPFLELLVCPQDLPATIGGPVLSYVASAGIADLTNKNLANGVFFDLTMSDSPQLSNEYLSEHDGTSNTIVFSENVQATTWDSTRHYDTIFVWHATTRPTKDMLVNGGELKSAVIAATARPSSKHRGGVNVAFADTHVMFLKETIDYRVYMQLMTPNGKDSDMPDEWKSFEVKKADLR